MKRINQVELALAITALGTMITAGVISMQVWRFETIGRAVSGYNGYSEMENVANSLDTGFDGGAVGFGIISAACILGIAWIESVRLKLDK
ncbi:MAG: hypothetical protein HWE14_13465 [Flavobacteriia bacterium]|nr:hypothetical protein [Flavobacteriia bacterium]